MKPEWTKPVFEDSAVGGECTAYAGAWRVGTASQGSKPDRDRAGVASIDAVVKARPILEGSASTRSSPAAS